MLIVLDGYLVVGCVVCVDYEEFQLDVVWCVYSDLIEDIILEDLVIWKVLSEVFWYCFVYFVISEVKIFVVL